MKVNKISMLLTRFTTERKQKKNNEKEKFKGVVIGEFIYSNRYLNLIYNAGKECYKGNKTDDVDEMRSFITSRVMQGHESILEHGNIILGFKIDNSLFNELLEFLEVCNYLKVKLNVKKEENNRIYMILAGSPRGYKHIIRYIKNPKNSILGELIEVLSTNVDSCLFVDLIKDNVLKNFFLNNTDRYGFKSYSYYESEYTNNCDYEVFNVDNTTTLIQRKINSQQSKIRLQEYLMEQYLVSKEDLLELFTITIYFKNMSRVISQQLTRHRNAITQQSQRYINYDKGVFRSPELFKPDKYIKDKKYNINIFGNDNQLTLNEIGESMIGVYKQLTKSSNGLLKEDARAFLPNNIGTSLYVTFTFFNFIHFLKLRSEVHAQAEIRMYANNFIKDILDGKIDILDGTNYETLCLMIEPLYKYLENCNIDDHYNIDEIIE